MIRLARLPGLHSGVEALRGSAEQEGFRFLSRLLAEWRSGSNRFDQSGEALVGAFRSDELVGICGLNRDPHLSDKRAGRLRHLYVDPATRRTGVATALVVDLLTLADRAFDVVRLRTDKPEAAAFYEKLGFFPVVDATASHVRALR